MRRASVEGVVVVVFDCWVGMGRGGGTTAPKAVLVVPAACVDCGHCEAVL